jgi:hypothetical protein
MTSTSHAPDCTCRAHPLPSSMRVRDARDRYLAENGFTVASYDDAWTEASFFGLSFAVPNTKAHRWAIMLHDLHHVATGFGTDLAGEGEISAWELRSGLAPLGLYVGTIVTSGAAFGLLAWTARTRDAFRAADGATTLWSTTARYERLLEMTVGELRALLGVPARGLATRTRALHPKAPPAGAAATIAIGAA